VTLRKGGCAAVSDPPTAPTITQSEPAACSCSPGQENETKLLQLTYHVEMTENMAHKLEEYLGSSGINKEDIDGRLLKSIQGLFPGVSYLTTKPIASNLAIYSGASGRTRAGPASLIITIFTVIAASILQLRWTQH
jgi:hypothetical protein